MAVMLSKDRSGASAPLLAYSWLLTGGPVWVSHKAKIAVSPFKIKEESEHDCSKEKRQSDQVISYP